MERQINLDISGLSRAAVLAALYNAATVVGLGSLDPRSGDEMTEADAQGHLDKFSPGQKIDYVQGRSIKVIFKADDTFRVLAYDRDNGWGAAEAAIAKLRASQPEA